MNNTKTTKVDVLDVIYRALMAPDAFNKCPEIACVDYDGDNHDGTVQLTLKDGTTWFISSEDIQGSEDLED